MRFAAGDRVTVRGERWVVEEATPFAGVTLLHLSSTEDLTERRHSRLLAPFDRPVATNYTPTLRVTTRKRWMRQLHAHLADVRTFSELRAPRGAAIDLLPFQLEPVLALIGGYASRFLLADEVGLGKTIQAGLMLAELRARGWCEHALIVTPAGLRQQWTDELRRRFGIRAAIIHASSLAALATSLPFDVNPWAVEPVVVTSVDFLKQPEVLRGVAGRLWDVVVVDEAHQAANAPLRYEAVNAVATRARHVMLLTATPHAGDDRAYRALCAIGAAGSPVDEARDRDDPILLFRRTRELAGLPRSRRAHLLPVAMTNDSAEMHRLLDAYLAQLWAIARESGKRDLQLVAMVLAKRAFSSARSLAASLERRLAGLTCENDRPAQATLPFVPDEDASDDPALPNIPAFERTHEERAIVERLIEAARRAELDDRKFHALQRLVRRVREPIIVFTEYRDTLQAIRDQVARIRSVTTLHGGQTPVERLRSVHDFTTGAADVMIATDAGSEGLNLQPTCRLVVNLELPWNPIRLEQRIGRVDRIGQTRTVHAINLLAAGTAERTVLASLLRRLDRIRLSEIDVAASVISRSEPLPARGPVDSCTRTIVLSREAREAAHGIAANRRFQTGGAQLSEAVVPIAVTRARHAALIAFFRTRLVTRAGKLIEDALLPLRLSLERSPSRLRPRDARALAETLIADVGDDLLRHARAHVDGCALALAFEAAVPIATALRRERAIIKQMASERPTLVQVGLFDNRALKEKDADAERREALSGESDIRANLMEADARVYLARDPELAMILIQCSRG